MRPEVAATLSRMSPDEQALLRPLVSTTRTYYIAVFVLAVVSAWGLYAYYLQVRHGLGTTGLNRPEYWGIYIIDFVFFIGISHAGTLISAILRVSQAEWRRSITRSAELITVIVIGFGAIQPIVDLGRPDRLLTILLHPNFGSPLLWDVVSIGLYFTSCTIYLYVPLLPDLAIIRDSGIKMPWLYRILAAGYRDTPEQREKLEKVIGVLSIAVIPIAVSVHTIIGWIFAMTLRPMWHSTIFGPYFVMGAIYSGIAAILVAMYFIRRAFDLEQYFKPIHFENLGKLLLLFSLLWFYFTFAEYLTAFYGGEPGEMQTFWAKVRGPYAFTFWTMVATCFVIPFAIMARKSTRTPEGTVVASVAVMIGMWLERFNIVVPTSVNPRWELAGLGQYTPSWVELSIMAGTFSGFALLYMISTKFIPIVSIWEIKEGRELSVREVSERVAAYLPDYTQVVVEESPSQSGTTGTLLLDITDPGNLLQDVRFKAAVGGAPHAFDDPDDGSWVTLTERPFTQFVALEKDRPSIVAYAVRYLAADGELKTLGGQHTFDFDTAPSLVCGLHLRGSDLLLSYRGDEDLNHIRHASTYALPAPSGEDVAHGTRIVGQRGDGVMIAKAVKSSTTVYVRVRGFSATGETATEDFTGALRRDPWQVAPTVRAVPSISGSVGRVALEINDPHGSVVETAFKNRPGARPEDLEDPTDGTWTRDQTDPFRLTEDVAITQDDAALIGWAVGYRDEAGEVQFLQGHAAFDPASIEATDEGASV